MHNFFPTYDRRLAEATPLSNLYAALSTLCYQEGRYSWLITGSSGHRNPPAVPYILHEHFYNRTGEFASADMIPVTHELAQELRDYTHGLDYLGGCDEHIRCLSGDNRTFHSAIEREATKLMAHLHPGPKPEDHGWSSCYSYAGAATAAHQAVSTTSGMGSIHAAIGVRFKNPLEEQWVVLFDEEVLAPEDYAERFGELGRKFFREHTGEK